MKSSENINEIATALCKFQGSLGSVKKDTKAYNYYYATLASIWDVIRMPLVENGLSVVQDTCTFEGAVSISTRILHMTGQWMEFGPLIVPMAKKDAHGAGSATTYGRRYCLCAALGIVADNEDDDGNGANGKAKVSDDEMIKQFLDKWGQEFGRESLITFIKERAELLNVKERPIVKMYTSNEQGFKKDFDSWLAKKSMEAENENG